MSEPIPKIIKPMFMYEPGELAVAFRKLRPKLWKANAFAKVKGGPMTGVSFTKRNSPACMGWAVLLDVESLTLRIDPHRAQAFLYQYLNSAQKCVWEIIWYLQQIDPGAFEPLPIDYQELALIWQRVDGVNHVGWHGKPLIVRSDDLL